MDPRGNTTLNLLTTVSAMLLTINDIITTPVAATIVALATMNQFLKPQKTKRVPVRVHTKTHYPKKYD